MIESGDPIAPRETRLRSGESALLRVLRPGDGVLLGDYLEGISEETRRRWRPHNLDRAAGHEICTRLDPADVLRMVATLQSESGERVIGYILIKPGAQEADRERYKRLGIPFDTATTAALAPSVTDAYQDQGVGSLLMEYALDAARQLGMRRIVLWGGVQATNDRAKHYYRKHGFQKVGEFFTDKDNDDMILELE